MNASNFQSDIRPLNAALREAVDFVHAEGWDRPATLFALVPAELVQDVPGRRRYRRRLVGR